MLVKPELGMLLDKSCECSSGQYCECWYARAVNAHQVSVVNAHHAKVVNAGQARVVNASGSVEKPTWSGLCMLLVQS